MNLTNQYQPSSGPVLALTRPETILVVDDHPELCEVAALFLQHCGYRVLTANGPSQAKRIARTNEPIDLLLTDVEMPELTGDELAAWFHATRPDTAVVFMSGNPIQHRRLAACPFVAKSFIYLDVLLKTIRETLHHNRTTTPALSAAA